MRLLKELVHGMSEEDAVSIVTFSGPQTYRVFNKCIQGDLQPGECGVHIQETMKDKDSAYESIENISWTRGSTLTSLALETASEIFNAHGRSEAEKIVVLITDGHPMQRHATQAQASSLRHSGIQIILVGVGNKFRSISRRDLRQFAVSKEEAFALGSGPHHPGLPDPNVPEILKRLC